MALDIGHARVTRSRSRGLAEETSQNPATSHSQQQSILNSAPVASTPFILLPHVTAHSDRPKQLPDTLKTNLLGITSRELKLLHLKQQKLKQFDIDQESARDEIRKNALLSTSIFAQQAAGTAVCIDASGLFLTCSHCVAETQEELHRVKQIPLLSSLGQAVVAQCTAWDPIRDLALLRVVAAQHSPDGPIVFHPLSIAIQMPRARSAIICAGHPGSEDLEAPEPGVQTNYPIISTSQGRFLGYSKGQDVQDNSEIGTLMHNAWTYWGHSGAPLVDAKTGQIIGLHSSWDDQTALRRGIGLEAIHEFLNSAQVVTQEL